MLIALKTLGLRNLSLKFKNLKFEIQIISHILTKVEIPKPLIRLNKRKKRDR